MIIWLNGPFGVGKTAVARALLEEKPDWALLDPEVRGAESVRQWPGVDDFQDLPEWRKAVVEDAVERVGTGRSGDPHDDLATRVLPRDHGRAEGRRGGPTVPTDSERSDDARTDRARPDRAGRGGLAAGPP